MPAEQRQKIKAYVRVRPALREELESPYWKLGLDVDDLSSNWIQLRKDGEGRRHFARVFGPHCSQEDVFRGVGYAAAEDALLGHMSTILCYGQTGTGKTYTLNCQATESMEGMIQRVLAMVFEKRVAEAHLYETAVQLEYIQLYRDCVQDLWNIDQADLPIRTDERGGAMVTGATVYDVANAQEAKRLVALGDENRVTANTRLSSASSRSHALLTVRIARRNKVTGVGQTGSIRFVDLAGSERVEKSGVTGEAFKDAIVINRSLTALGHCVQGLVKKENVAAFRDSKLTRLLQVALTGIGRTSFICTVRPDLESIFETSATLAFAERAQQVQTGMTSAAYRDVEASIRSEIVAQLREAETQLRSARFIERGVETFHTTFRKAQDDVDNYNANIETTMQRIRDQLHQQQQELLAQHDADLALMSSQTTDAVAEIRESHAVTFKRYDERVAFAVGAEERTLERVTKQIAERHQALQAVLDQTWDDLQNAEPDEESVNDKVARRRAVLLSQLDTKRKLRRSTRPSPNAAMPLETIIERTPKANLVRDSLRDYREMLLSKCTAFGVRPRTRWREGRRELPTHFEMLTFGEKVHQRRVTLAEDAARALETSDELSDETSTETTSGTSASWGSSLLSSSGSGSKSTFFEKPMPWDDDIGDGGSSIEIVQERFDQAVQEEEDLAKMKENVFRALHGGTSVYVINPPSDWVASVLNMVPPSPPRPTTITKAFLALNRDRTGVILQPPDDDAREIFFRDCQVTLGQYSASFAAATDNMPVVQSGTPMPPTSARITPEAIPLFFYRSFTLVLTAIRSTIDIVVDTDQDFEAWTMTFLYLALLEPIWGRSLDISTMPRMDELTEGEQLCCAYHHIHPEIYLKFREALARFDPPLLFITPMRIRELAGVDVLHSMKVLSFLISNGDVESVKLYCNQYKFYLQQEALADLDRQIVRALRLRIINMLRRYRPSPAAVVQQYLREHEGREQEVLDGLVAQYGPEPTDVPEVTPDDALVEDTEENVEKSNRERRIEDAEVKRFSKYGFMLDMADKAMLQLENIDTFVRTPYASDTLAARLDVLRRSLLTHERLQRTTAMFVDMDCVSQPWYMDVPAQYRSLQGEVHEFVGRSVLEPGADKCLLLLGAEGSGKSALCRFMFQYYLCKLDLESVAANAMNSNAIQLLTAASTGSTVIPCLIEVSASAKPFADLIAEGLSKMLGIHFGHTVPEGSLDVPLITVEQLAQLELLFIVDGIDEITTFSDDGVMDGDGVMLELLRRFAASVSDDPSSRLFGCNKMDIWRKSKFIFTCRHLPQVRSDRLNTNVHNFLKAFVAPTARAGPPSADVDRVSVLYICPLSGEKQQQYLYRFILGCLRLATRSRTMAVHTSLHNMTFFQRGFAGVDYFALEMRKIKDWFIYARTPGLLEHIAVSLPYLSQQPDTEEKRQRNSLAAILQQSIEVQIRESIESLGLDNVPAELRKRDARQALQLYCFETALAMARSGKSRLAAPWMGRPTTSRLGMVPLAEDPAQSYFKMAGPFWQTPLFSAGLNPTVVTLRRHPKAHTRMFALIADETHFATRQVQAYFTALMVSKQLLTNPSDSTMLLNQVGFQNSEITLRLIYDHVGREKLFTLVQLAKKAGGALALAASNAVSALNAANVPLVGIDLNGLNLTATTLRFALLEQANLSNTRLQGVNLAGAQLSRANLTGASVKGASFRDWARVREDDMLMAAALNTAGNVLYTAGFEGNITMYDAPTARELAVISGHTACVTQIALSTSKLVVVSGSEDGSVRVWEATTGAQRYRFVGHEDNVTCVALSSDDKIVASGSDDRSIILWSMETGGTIVQLTGHRASVTSVCFSPDNKKLLSTSEDGRIVGWTLAGKHGFLATIATFDFPLRCVRYSPKGDMIACGGDDGNLYLFDNTGEPRAKLQGTTRRYIPSTSHSRAPSS
jgi:hypothetical protein